MVIHLPVDDWNQNEAVADESEDDDDGEDDDLGEVGLDVAAGVDGNSCGSVLVNEASRWNRGWKGSAAEAVSAVFGKQGLCKKNGNRLQ